MRMLMKVIVPNDGGNKTVKDGTIGQIIGGFMEERRPEAAYFVTEAGERAALFVLDVKDVSDIPSLAEPFFNNVNARVSFVPAMNAQDLKAGIAKVRL